MCREYVTFLCQSGAAKSALIDPRLQTWLKRGPGSIDLCVFASSHGVCHFYHPLPRSNSIPGPRLMPSKCQSRLALCCWCRNKDDQTVALVCFVLMSFCHLGVVMCGARIRELLYCNSVLFGSITEKMLTSWFICWCGSALRNTQWHSLTCFFSPFGTPPAVPEMICRKGRLLCSSPSP